MMIDEILAHILAQLRRQGRISYDDIRAQYHLDEEALAALKHRIMEVGQAMIDEKGVALVNPEALAADIDRPQLTVLCCDVVGSTALSSALDPEDLRAVVRDYQRVSVEVIEHFGGHVAQYLGDGLMVYFGYPVSHTDDAQRAVAAGLQLLAAMAALNERLELQSRVRLAVRIGIHSGSVVVGELGDGQAQLAVGETPNVAAGLVALAKPDTVVVSEATAELIADAFDCDPLGIYHLEGVTEPVLMSRVRPVHGRPFGLTEFTGLTDTSATGGRAGRSDVDHAERRQLTVMFCDLADAGTLAIQLTPETLLEVVQAYQEASAGTVAHFGGHIAQYLDHGLLVYFGYPYAHEDDAQRAVRTALGMIEGMTALNAHLASRYQVRVAVRIGIHTGLVVAGEMGGGSRTEQLAVGEALNLAARIQGLAEPNTVVISAATHRLLGDELGVEELGLHTLRGITEPISVNRVLGVRETNRPGAVVAGRTGLVGREAELNMLQDRWAQSVAGQGQAVLLNGDAGIGKSRLVTALREVVGHEGALQVTFRCSPYHRNSALHPVITHLERVLQFRREETPEARWAKLERVLGTYRFPESDTLPLLADLLSIALPPHVPSVQLTSAQQRLRTQELLLAWLMEDVERQPILMVCEDLHWADPSTLEMLDLLLDYIASKQMLTVMTCRPEFQAPWEIRPNLTPLSLNRLEEDEVAAIVERVTLGKTLPASLLNQITSRTDGIPLFVEEMTKTILESGMLREVDGRYELTGRLSELSIPATLQDSLMARLDRLGSAKHLAQLGAVIGRESPYELLSAVWDGDEMSLQTWLDQLVEVEMMLERGPRPQAVYTFKHALIQDTAYQSLLRSTRQRYHQQIAEVLENEFGNIVDAQPELLARHYSEAGQVQQAAEYWLRAGQQAIQRSANQEAIEHLKAGLNALHLLPETPKRIEDELTFRLSMGSPLIATRGYAAPEVRDNYARARYLSRGLQGIPRRLEVAMGLWMFYAVRAELSTAQELAEQLLSLSQSQPDPALFLEAEQALGITYSMRGMLAPARAHFERGIAIYDPNRHREHAFSYGQDSKVVCLCHVAIVLWLLGEPDAALERCQEAMRLASDLSHPFSRSWALYYTAMVHQLRREAPKTQAYAEALIELCQEQGFAYRQVQGNILREWARAEQGHGAPEVDKMRQGLEAVRATGAEVYRPYYLAVLAEVYSKLGEHETALTGLNEILAIVETTNERFYEAELHRLKGEMLAKLGNADPAAADDCFQLALQVAQQQGAKSLELRAALSRSRLWQRQHRRDEARELLAEVTARFAPEVDTADLQEARTLLAQWV